MNSKIPINVTIDSGSLSLPASPIFQKEKSTYAVKTEMKLRARELGLDDNDISDDAPAENTSESKEPSLDDIKAKLNDLIASASPVKKSAAQKAVKAAGLSTAFRSMTDIEELKKVAAIMEKELS